MKNTIIDDFFGEAIKMAESLKKSPKDAAKKAARARKRKRKAAK